MELLDTTLREGEQAAGISFSFNQKKKILMALDEFGVEFIEIGHPVVNKKIETHVKKLSKIETNTKKLVHARALEQDILMASQTNAEYIGIFLCSSDIGIKTKYSFGKKEILNKLKKSLKLAKSFGLKTRFTAEDATRTNFSFLVKLFETAKKHGAERISIADTTGCFTPWKMELLVKQILKKIKNVKLHVHCHNDLGLAVANSVAAIKAGAVLADASINGIGERCGITDLSQISAIAREEFGEKRKTKLLSRLSSMVAKFSGIPVSEFHPITGKNAFCHKSGLHTNAVLKNPKSYECLKPENYGRKRIIVVDQFTGRAAFKKRLEELGIKLNEKYFEKAFLTLKNFPKKWITDSDLIEIAFSVDSGIKLSENKKIEGFVSITLDKTALSPNISFIISGLPGIKKVFETSGEADIVALTETKTISELNNLIDKINTFDGVKKTASKIVMRELKR